MDFATKVKTACIALFILMTCSCAAVKDIKTLHASDFSITNYKTFNFLDLDTTGEMGSNFNTRIGWIKEEVAKQLTAKGLNQTSENPDLHINIGITIEEKIQTRETDFTTDRTRYMGQRNYSWQSEEIEVGRYKEGTVKIELVDRSKNKAVWEGSAASVVLKKDEASKKNIAVGMEKLFTSMK